MTPEDWRKIDERIASFAKFKERRDHNKAIIDRVKGAPAQPGTPETEADPRNPNAGH